MSLAHIPVLIVMYRVYCDTVYCDKMLIGIVFAIPKWHFYSKKFADILTFFNKFLLIVTFLNLKMGEIR